MMTARYGATSEQASDSHFNFGQSPCFRQRALFSGFKFVVQVVLNFCQRTGEQVFFADVSFCSLLLVAHAALWASHRDVVAVSLAEDLNCQNDTCWAPASSNEGEGQKTVGVTLR